MQRSDIKFLVEEIYNTQKVDTLTLKEQYFLKSIRNQVQVYGFTFSEKQVNWLQNILEKLK
jgi:hypothetical protein